MEWERERLRRWLVVFLDRPLVCSLSDVSVGCASGVFTRSRVGLRFWSFCAQGSLRAIVVVVGQRYAPTSGRMETVMGE